MADTTQISQFGARVLMCGAFSSRLPGVRTLAAGAKIGQLYMDGNREGEP